MSLFSHRLLRTLIWKSYENWVLALSALFIMESGEVPMLQSNASMIDVLPGSLQNKNAWFVSCDPYVVHKFCIWNEELC